MTHNPDQKDLSPQADTDATGEPDQSRDAGGDVFEQLPPQKQMERVVERSMMGMFQGHLPDPVREKVTSEHVSQTLDLMKDGQEKSYQIEVKKQDRLSSNRNYALAVFIVIILAIGAMCFFFKEQPDVLVPVVTGIISFGAGAFGGYGVGRSHSPGD